LSLNTVVPAVSEAVHAPEPNTVCWDAAAVESTSSLIAEIYDAALDPSRWGVALENTAKYVGGAGVTLRLEIAEVSPHLRYFNHKDFWQKRLSTEPLASGAPLGPDASTFSGNVFCHFPAEHLETRLSERPVAPGTYDGALKCVARFTLDKPGDDDGWIEVAKQRLPLIFPHVHRALHICKAIVRKRATVAALEDTLDGLDAGIFLVNALGQMVDANSSGNAMLKGGRFVGSARGKLMANGRESGGGPGARFIPENSRGAGAEPDAAADSMGYVTHSFPIATEVERHDGDERQAVAGFILHEAMLPNDGSVDRISSHYRLALRERQVLQAIVDGYGVTQIARRLAIAHSTAKTYLNRLFEKTCTKNQTDLIKLCAAFRSPFAGGQDAK